jgi:hypothetical protein
MSKPEDLPDAYETFPVPVISQHDTVNSTAVPEDRLDPALRSTRPTKPLPPTTEESYSIDTPDIEIPDMKTAHLPIAAIGSPTCVNDTSRSDENFQVHVLQRRAGLVIAALRRMPLLYMEYLALNPDITYDLNIPTLTDEVAQKLSQKASQALRIQDIPLQAIIAFCVTGTKNEQGINNQLRVQTIRDAIEQSVATGTI